MKNILLIISLLVSHQIVQAADSLVIKAEKLKDLYSRVITAKDAQSRQAYEIAYFNEFPENFQELVALYGFENDVPAILYDESDKHIYKLYNNLTSVNDTAYLAKSIAIAVDGKWDADGINIFQDVLTQRIILQKELTVFLLMRMQPEQVRSFWYFIFDGPHPDKQFKTNSGLKEFETIDKNIYSIMMEAYEQVLADSEPHGH